MNMTTLVIVASSVKINGIGFNSNINHVGDDLMLYNHGSNSIDSYDYAMVSGEVSDSIKLPCICPVI